MALLAGFQALLSRYSGEEQIVVGTDLANRTMSETEPLIGFFINLLALRTDLSGNPTFREVLTRVREVTLGAYAHQDMPFDKLVEELQPERSLSHNPLVQVLFVMQNIPKLNRELPGLELLPFEMPITRSKQGAVITRDRMRIDIEADFYVRVQPTVEAVSIAAARLGRRTLERALIQAAEMEI